MATQFSSPVTAAQVGTYFVGQYYQVLQQAPDSVYQFYSEASTMLRTDGNIRDTASAMLPPLNSSRPASSEWNHIPEPANYQVAALSDSIEKSGTYMNAIEEEEEEEDEIKSVYVKNIQPSMTESEIEEGFKKFGEIKPDGVIIRSRKDIGICYAFVEFEDMTGVQNAIEAGSTHVAGRPVYIEERRPNCFIPSRGASMYSILNHQPSLFETIHTFKEEGAGVVEATTQKLQGGVMSLAAMDRMEVTETTPGQEDQEMVTIDQALAKSRASKFTIHQSKYEEMLKYFVQNRSFLDFERRDQ
ncbi:hypothetical protein ACFE04_008811 [Oxalis oulophora]